MIQLLSGFSFLFGAVVGSFLNVVILRLPNNKESIVYPPSHCPLCKADILWYDNMPIISYLFLGGKCRKCNEKISLQYPLVELGMGLLTLALFHQFGLSIEFFIFFLFSAALMVIIFIDLHHQIIPDIISLPGIAIGFASSFFIKTVSWQDSGLGILIGGGILYSIALIYYLITKKDGMGGGDIKLLAMIGGFLGWQSLLFVVFASSLTGSAVGIVSMCTHGKGTKTKIPFGPFLSLAALTYLFFENDILRWWHNYISL